MKAFVFYTESHQGLLEDFLVPSLPDDLELVLHAGEQKCRDASYLSAGWLECMRDKVGMVIAAIEANEGECILHLDADIQFFTKQVEPLLMRQLEGFDLVAQSDGRDGEGPLFCGGLFALRCCASTRDLFVRVLALMSARRIHDQDAMNEALRELKLRAQLLPSNLFWSPRTLWRSGMPLNLPSCAVAHHANWCTGTEQKRLQLEEGGRIHRASQGLERHGSEYGGKWIVRDSLNEDSVVYSAGVGEDITFDTAVMERYGTRIHAFDPTPRAVEYVERASLDRERFLFQPVALLDREGEASFYVPQDPNHVSHSIFNLGGGCVSLPVRRIDGIIRELGHQRIDLMKLDVEGSEYALIERLLSSSIRILPRQIVVEFHDWLGAELGARTKGTIESLLRSGYALLHREGHDYTFALREEVNTCLK